MESNAENKRTPRSSEDLKERGVFATSERSPRFHSSRQLSAAADRTSLSGGRQAERAGRSGPCIRASAGLLRALKACSWNKRGCAGHGFESEQDRLCLQSFHRPTGSIHPRTHHPSKHLTKSTIQELTEPYIYAAHSVLVHFCADNLVDSQCKLPF
ncbi:hypothetical protein NDU88_004753 [Pleurodeles waltl]|uniref:Uncharacterized protein n=1 Tax=Pleurodeles waltl TaxID=8319 RepID=A0AAV7T9E1_PLEWA|nr:hypothetical protein NDU88_004753 [Pleurodeles waltl]